MKQNPLLARSVRQFPLNMTSQIHKYQNPYSRWFFGRALVGNVAIKMFPILTLLSLMSAVMVAQANKTHNRNHKREKVHEFKIHMIAPKASGCDRLNVLKITTNVHNILFLSRLLGFFLCKYFESALKRARLGNIVVEMKMRKLQIRLGPQHKILAIFQLLCQFHTVWMISSRPREVIILVRMSQINDLLIFSQIFVIPAANQIVKVRTHT